MLPETTSITEEALDTDQEVCLSNLSPRRTRATSQLQNENLEAIRNEPSSEVNDVEITVESEEKSDSQIESDIAVSKPQPDEKNEVIRRLKVEFSIEKSKDLNETLEEGEIRDEPVEVIDISDEEKKDSDTESNISTSEDQNENSEEIGDELREVENELKKELNKLKSKMKSELREELREELKKGIRQELKKELREELKTSLREELKID